MKSIPFFNPSVTIKGFPMTPARDPAPRMGPATPQKSAPPAAGSMPGSVPVATGSAARVRTEFGLFTGDRVSKKPNLIELFPLFSS